MYQIKRPSTFDEVLAHGTKKLRTISNEKKNEITCFEYLSNELFYEIFEYLDGIDIYQIFFNLNSRFQHLLIHSSMPLKIKLSSELETELVRHCDNMIKPNRHRILSLFCQNNVSINNFFTFWSIDLSFDRLESIVLNGILSETSMLVLFHLKTLPRLFSLTMDFHMIEGSHLDDIYQIIFSLSCLKYNKLSILSDFVIEFMDPFASVLLFNQQFSTIEYLIINHSCTIAKLHSILRYVPHLRHLSCQDLDVSFTNMDLIQPIMLPNLTYISIINPLMMFFEFEKLIMNLSTGIKILKIDLFDDITFLNAYRWEQLIIKHMPQLCKFYLTHRESEMRMEDISVPQLVNEFTSSFWIKRQWFVECVIDCAGAHYSVRPYRNIYLDIYQHAEIATYFSYSIHNNSASQIIQLQIDEISGNESHEVFLDQLKTIYIDIPFTRLNIKCRNISMGILVRIIYLFPNLDSLKVSSLPLIQPNWLFDDNDKEIRFITSFKNKITEVNLTKIIDIEQIHFILQLCPCVQYLQMDIPSNIDLDKLIRFILIKSSTFIPHLCSLCLTIPNADNKLVDHLDNLIKSEKFLINYKIERIHNHILLKWN